MVDDSDCLDWEGFGVCCNLFVLLYGFTLWVLHRKVFKEASYFKTASLALPLCVMLLVVMMFVFCWCDSFGLSSFMVC